MSKKKRGYPIIKQRTATSPISITNRLGDTDIVLEIKATKENWEKLVRFSSDRFHHQHREMLTDPEYNYDIVTFPDTELQKVMWQQLGELIECSFVPFADGKVNGVSQGNRDVLKLMKVEAAVIYEFIKYCINKGPSHHIFVLDLFAPEYMNDALFCSAFLSQTVLDLFGYFEVTNTKPFIPYNEADDIFSHENFYITYVSAGRQVLKTEYDFVVKALLYLTINLLKAIPNISTEEKDRNEFLSLWLAIFHCAFFHVPTVDDDPFNKEIRIYRKILLNIFPQFFYEKNGVIHTNDSDNVGYRKVLDPLLRKVISNFSR